MMVMGLSGDMREQSRGQRFPSAGVAKPPVYGRSRATVFSDETRMEKKRRNE